MKRTMLLLVLLVQVSWLQAQLDYKGIVTDMNGKPLAGVTVAADNRNFAFTDSSGHFFFTDTAASLLLHFSRIGYTTAIATYATGNNFQVRLAVDEQLLEEAIIRAYETNGSLQRTPAAVYQLSRSSLERFDNLSILPAINTVPGVKMDERSPGSYRLSIRGNLLRSPFGVRNVKVYWNGIPFTDASGNTYLNQIDYNNIGGVEIIKGPGGSMYGAGTGGVVLLSGRQAPGMEQRITLKTAAGSYGSFNSNIAYSHANAQSNGVLQFSHQQQDGWRNHTNMRRDVANYTSSYRISTKQELYANLFYSDLYYQTPGGLTPAQLASNPRQARPPGAIFGGAESQQAALYISTLYAGLSNEYKFSNAWNNTTAVYTSATKFRNPSILNYQRKTEQGVGARSVFRLQKSQYNLNIGAEYQNGFTASRTFGNKQGRPDTLQVDDEIASLQYNLFVQASYTPSSHIKVEAGVSYNRYQYGFSRLNQLPFNSIERTFTPVLIPRLSILGSINNQSSVYMTVSGGFSPPTIDELVPSTGIFNAALEAEKATNIELGWRGWPIANKLWIDASLYWLQLGNTIVTRRDNSGADYFVNTGNTSQKGIEMAARYYAVRNGKGWLNELTCWSNVSVTHARFATYKQGSNDYSGNKLTGTPEHVIAIGTDISTRPGLYANFTYSYTAAIPLNDANTYFGNAYNLLFIRLGYKTNLSKQVQLSCFGSYNTSFNVPYSLGNDLNAAGNRFYNPAAPHQLQAGIQFDFSLKPHL